MAEKQSGFSARVEFVGLGEGEKPPSVAVYSIDVLGRPQKRLGKLEGDSLHVPVEWQKQGVIALGPDMENVSDVPPESLVSYRLDTIASHWRENGILLGPEIWYRFHFQTICVSGTARKCRPWWWRRLEAIERVLPAVQLLARPELQLHFPARCLPLCDGIVEVFERECCCRRIYIPDLIDRLRKILQVIPIPLPHPPGPGPELESLRMLSASFRPAPAMQQKTAGRLGVDAGVAGAGPGERLYNDYLELVRLDGPAAQAYVEAHSYLIGFLCHCHTTLVGEVPLQPSGRISFCYRRPRRIPTVFTHCRRSYAYRIRQKIGGAWVVIYDGLAAHDWFAEGQDADIRTWDWRAQVCGSGPGDPPPNEGLPFVMLEYVTGAGTHHFNFPAQDGVSHVGMLDANDGLFTTGYAPDCPWGSGLGLRLWFSPELEPIAKYYRVSVVAVNDAGAPTGSVSVLKDPVTWSRFEFVAGDWVSVPELLTMLPADVGGQDGLNRIPYWSGGKNWLSGQNHQVWNTNLFGDGKYLAVVEVFDAAASRIKPTGAVGSGTAAGFQLRRWDTDTHTANVAFADLAHVFWIDNTPVGGDIVDIRKDGIPNTEECQFVSGTNATNISIGFRAYHIHGVSDPTNTFMASYGLTWQRGLNGPSGVFETGTNDVGEPPALPHASTALTVGFLLGPFPPSFPAQQKCTFAAQLHVNAKHFTGGGRITWYDFDETASFALSL